MQLKSFRGESLREAHACKDVNNLHTLELRGGGKAKMNGTGTGASAAACRIDSRSGKNHGASRSSASKKTNRTAATTKRCMFAATDGARLSALSLPVALCRRNKKETFHPPQQETSI